MDIEAWFETMPSHVVNDIAQEKRYIGYAIHDVDALRFANQDHIIKDILTMSRKVKNARNTVPTTSAAEKSNGAGGGGSGGKTRWASADIRSKEHKQAVRALASNVNFVLDTLVELVDDGYDLHVKRTDQGSTVRSMLFCTSKGDVNSGGGLSAEAPDAWLSLTALVYKHATVLDGKWFAEGDEDSEDDGWR